MSAPAQHQAGVGRRLRFRPWRVLAWTVGTFAFVITALGATMWYWPNTATIFSAVFGERGPIVERDIAFGEHTRQRLDLYRPPAGTPERAAIIVFLYGGSWSSGSKDVYAFVGQALAARGFTTVIPDYRLYPDVQFPAFVEDTAAAYAWASLNLAERCNPARPIIVAGHSAGGHMAALLAYDPRYIAQASATALPPAAIIGLAGPYTFEPTRWPSTKDAFASVADTPDVPRPVTFVRPTAPPALLLHGAADELVHLKNTRELAAALREAGSTTDTEIYPGIGHIGLVLTLARPLRWRAPTLEHMVTFAARFRQNSGNSGSEFTACARP